MKIVTIGGGNGQSNLLSAFYEYLGKNEKMRKIVKLSAIVSMSDDGRTTGKLMRAFDSELGIHLPPPGDLRRCLFALSDSKFRKNFQMLFESLVSDEDEPIKNFTIKKIFFETIKKILSDEKIFPITEKIYEDGRKIIIEEKNFSDEEKKLLQVKKNFEEFLHQEGFFFEHVKKILGEFLDYKIPLEEVIKGHKCGNLIMAGLYTEKGKFGAMIQRIHKLMKVPFDVIPVTMEKANIIAETDKGEVIESQDAISNAVDYEGRIETLQLTDCSKESDFNPYAGKKIEEADYIFIGPGDIFTSIGANFIFPKTKGYFQNTKAKIYFIANNTNKKGEASGFKVIDFIDEVINFLGVKIDGIFVNNKRLDLNLADLDRFKNDISVKGGDFVYTTPQEEEYFKAKGIKVIKGDFLDRKTFYKHNKENLMEKIFDEIEDTKEERISRKFIDFMKKAFGK
ncbi:2-phospho-L-lactate transferase CofD family protein [Candidatus Gracilibacteria bacterium]|nr:2-phospho-L-lactate transferase CofD family protein [Candidatus Gracilibacteria bacterium]